MRLELKRIGIFSAVKTMFVLGGVSGFLLGIVQWLLLMFVQQATMSMPSELSGFEQEAFAELLGAGMGALGLLLPLFGGFIGAIGGIFFGAILGMVYNLSARLWGGLEYEHEEVRPSAAAVILPSSPSRGEPTPLPTVGAAASPPRPELPADSRQRPPAMYE